MEHNEELKGITTYIPKFGKDLKRAKEFAETVYESTKGMLPHNRILEIPFIWEDFHCKLKDLIDDPN